MDAQWQKKTINLNSVIDSNMTDMLRYIDDPAFIFNRQVLQGGYLPTSLRYEDNGWFCGKYGYDFELNSPVALKDSQLFMGDMKVERRHSYVSETYQITSDDESGDVDFIYYPLSRVLAYASETEPVTELIADDDGNLTIIKVTGKTHDFKNDYTFYIDISDESDLKIARPDDWVIVDPEEAIDFDGDGNPDVQTTITFDKRRFVYEYTVYDKDEFFSDSFTLHYITPFYIGDEVHEPVVNESRITYGDNNILTVNIDTDGSPTVSVTSDEIDISSATLCFDADNNMCAVDVAGNIPITVTDNLTAVTQKYYTDLDLCQCLCTSSSSIGKNPTATVMRGNETCQIPLVAAGYTCLAASCAFEACNNLCTGCNTYAENISGAVPIWSAQTIYVLRFFGDDIFAAGENADNSGTVLTFVPQQSFTSSCCTIEQDDQHQFYCTIYGNKIYCHECDVSKSHVFSSGGKWYTGAVNQCTAAASYKKCIDTCVPLVYSPTGQCVNVNVCILLDTMASNMAVQTVGCIAKMTADANGFSVGKFGRSCAFAPIPGSIPQFVIHDPFSLSICNSAPWSQKFADYVLGSIKACSIGEGASVAESLQNASSCLYNYWHNNKFYANMQITPVSVIFPVAGWFNSNVCFKGVDSVEHTDRHYLDTFDKSMFCINTEYCYFDPDICVKSVLVCELPLVQAQTTEITGNFQYGGFIAVQSSNGCDGCAGCPTKWSIQQTDNNPPSLTVCPGSAGQGGISGTSFLIQDICQQVYDTDTNDYVWCESDKYYQIGGGGGGGGGLPGFIGGFGSSCVAPTACNCPYACVGELITFTSGRTQISLANMSGTVEGSAGGKGGKGAYAEIPLCCSGINADTSVCIRFCSFCCTCLGEITGNTTPETFAWTCCPIEGTTNSCIQGPTIFFDGACYFAGYGAAECSLGGDAYTKGQDGTLFDDAAIFDTHGVCTVADFCDVVTALRTWQPDYNLQFCVGAGGYGYATYTEDKDTHRQGTLEHAECDTNVAKVSVYAYQYTEDVNYDTTNLQNENNCFGIHLKCNDITLNNLLLCCCKQGVDKYNLELIPTLSDGYIYIISSADAMPAWATSQALISGDFWCDGNTSLVPEYDATYKCTEATCSIAGVFENGVSFDIQSSKGCDGGIGEGVFGGSSGYGICLSWCDATCNTRCCCIIPGGAGGASIPKSTINAPLLRLYGLAGSGSSGQAVHIDITGKCICDIEYCITCNTANSYNGANSTFCADGTNNGGEGVYISYDVFCSQTYSYGGSGHRVDGACFVDSSDYFIKVYNMVQMTGVEPWSVSTDTATATKLGISRDLATSLLLPVDFYNVDRLIDAAVSSTHDSYYNLSVLDGACAIDTNIVFTDACGCTHCSAGEWTRDTAVCNGKYINPCAKILHGSSCAKDYMVEFDLDKSCYKERLMSPDGCPKNSYVAVASECKGNYNCSLTPGYSSTECVLNYMASVENHSDLSEPYMLVNWNANYPFCTLLTLPYATNSADTDITRDAVVHTVNKGVYTIGYNDNADTIVYDSCQESISSKVYSADVCCIYCPSPDTLPKTMCACVCGSDFDYATFTLEGIYKNCGNEELNVKCVTGDTLKVEYSTCGETEISKEDIINNKTFLDVTAKDIEKPEEEKKTIASVELNSEFQLVKQQWDTTVETENMWWLDEDHIMLLTKDKFIIKQKQYDEETGEAKYDDWNGDQWKVIAEYQRTKYINSTVTKFGVSNTYDQTAADNGGTFLYTFTIQSSSRFRLDVYSPLDSMNKLFSQVFNIKELNYGEELSTAYNELSMYVFVNAKTLISQADISATHVAHHYVVGIHFDSCLRQWAFFFDDEDYNCKKITGYGYVAPNGTLTGGQFPSIHVNAENGFTGAVNFIDDLQNVKNNSVNGSFTSDGIYGTQEQQWYIYKEIPKICSHIQFAETAEVKNGGPFVNPPLVCKWLPLKSSYSAMYSSPSFLLNRITGFMPEPTTLESIFDFGNSSIDTLVNVLTAIASPTIWFLNICWTKFGYLNQAIGQYAYTYRCTDRDISLDAAKFNADTQAAAGTNSYASKEMKAFEQNGNVLTRDALSFDKQEFEQTCTTKSDSNGGITSFWLCLLQAGISGVNNAASAIPPVVNESLNVSDTANAAKGLSQFAMENALNSVATDLGVQKATDVILASKVTAVKTLDMFYSTSANTRMYAGPGYVCHNFIGYCVAQSMCNSFLKGSQSTMFTALTILSNLSFMFKTVILKAVQHLLEKLAKSLNPADTKFMGSGVTWGVFAAMAMRAGAFVADQLVQTNEFFMNVLPDIIGAICPGYPNAQFSTPGLKSKHSIEIEAKHNYGSKHVTFMYPCFGCESTYFTKETVEAVLKDITVEDEFTPQNSIIKAGKGNKTLYTSAIDNVTDNSNDEFKSTLKGKIHTHYIYAKGKSSVDNVPPDTAVIEGTTTFLPSVPFKNENIDVNMVFPTAPVQDYMIDDMWNIGITANEGGVLWVSVKDTKLLDGSYSNIIITDDAAMVASPYTAVEFKKQIEKEYIRPVAITPNALAWNMTGLNVSYNGKMYHGFDGTGYRVVHWAGTSGMGTEDLTLHYCFQENNHFKRSNILMPNHFFGNFTSLPVIDADTDNKDSLYHQIEIDTKGIGIENLTSAENKNLARYAIPVFTEQLSTMPSVIKTLSSYKLNVIQGVTSLTSDIRITQNKYKIPKSIDFNINKNLYRATDEYINALNESGLSVGDLTSKLGLEFIGATPTQAFFYSDATRSYYSFTGNAMIQKQDVWNRFKDIKDGKWDFVNQNVVFQCIGNMTRVMDDVSDRDDDLVDNIFIATMDGQQHGITGEVTPPGTPVFNNKSWFKTYSFAGGLTFQGPNRYVVNRFICLDYMINDIVANKGKWKKLKRDKFNPFRKYKEDFVAVNDRVTEGVSGWTHNPFVLATAPLGVSEETDCLFEWELTFTWTDEMDRIYKDNEYACVNIMAQTMCPGGKKRCEPTHLYLHKDLFTRSDNTGYYSFKFASRNGAGNREQLFIWSDAYVAMTGLSVNYKVITERRTMPLTTSQIDIREMKEF